MKKIYSLCCLFASILSLTLTSCQKQNVLSSTDGINNSSVSSKSDFSIQSSKASFSNGFSMSGFSGVVYIDAPLSNFCPWINTIEEQDIDKATYQIKKRDYEGKYSLCDYLETYVSDSQDDIHATYQFLKNCYVRELSGSNPYRIYYDKDVTFSVFLKNGKRLDIYGTDGHELDIVYEDNCIVHIKTNVGLITTNSFLSKLYLSMTLPLMSKLYGYSYNKLYFDNCSVQDRMNNFDYVYNINPRKLTNALFAPEDSFTISSEMNDYNRYSISAQDEGNIIFESSKCFFITYSKGVRGRYRIINDFSFEDLFIDVLK